RLPPDTRLLATRLRPGVGSTLLARLLGRLATLRRRLLAVQPLFLRLAEEGRQRPFAHARPLTAFHPPGPPLRAAGRRTRPSRQGRISEPTFPSRAPRRSAPSS